MNARSRAACRTVVAGLILAVFSALPARAADTKIGYIDSARIFQEYKDAQEAQARFDRLVQGWKDEAAEKDKLVQQLRAEVRDQGPILSALKRQEKEDALQKSVADYERFIQSIWGPQGRAAQENERSTKDVVEQIRVVVEKLAGDRGLSLVLDAAGGFIIYADKGLDLSGAVIQELNAKSAASGAK
jgi:outer membrane protein